MNSCLGKEIRELKVEGIMKLQRRLGVNTKAPAEIGFCFGAVKLSRILSTWFEDNREVCAILANNIYNPGSS